MRLRRALAGLVALVAFVACTPADHAPDTKDLIVRMRIDQPEGGGRVHYEATFSRGGAYLPIPLDEGDEIRVMPSGAPEGTLVSDRNPIGIMYTLDRDDPPFPSATFVLARVRGGSASSTATFTPSLTDFTPAEGSTLAYGDGSATLTMRWSNKVDGALVKFVTHACDHADNRAPSDPDPDKGGLVVPLKDLVVDGAPKAPTCLRLELHRGLPGTLDPTISAAGSSIAGYLVHTSTITITP